MKKEGTMAGIDVMEEVKAEVVVREDDPVTMTDIEIETETAAAAAEHGMGWIS